MFCLEQQITLKSPRDQSKGARRKERVQLSRRTKHYTLTLKTFF